MLFTEIMSRKTIYSFITLIILLFLTRILTASGENNDAFSKRVKVTLRDVGHQLLHANNDSTSLILPIVKIEKATYKLSFQKQLSFEPSNLVRIVKNSFKKASFPEHYLVEVIQCTDHEVAYSYEMKYSEEKAIIPCKGRLLPQNCYTIVVKFIDKTTSSHIRLYLYIVIFISFLILQFFFFKKKPVKIIEDNNLAYASIGSFKFYPEQNKLVKEAEEISLSKKECELLSIFIENLNQIIKRDELMKRVWEDHGVFVGRSLDTYISKLRKKLKDDSAIKLTNVHGVGYKLEVS